MLDLFGVPKINFILFMISSEIWFWFSELLIFEIFSKLIAGPDNLFFNLSYCLAIFLSSLSNEYSLPVAVSIFLSPLSNKLSPSSPRLFSEFIPFSFFLDSLNCLSNFWYKSFSFFIWGKSIKEFIKLGQWAIFPINWFKAIVPNIYIVPSFVLIPSKIYFKAIVKRSPSITLLLIIFPNNSAAIFISGSGYWW